MNHEHSDLPPGFKSAPKPANLDELTAAAAAHDGEAFAREHAKYRDQVSRAGSHPGTLLGWLDEDGTLS